MAGKGDKPRPVNKTEYNKNFDLIIWNNHKAKSKTKKINGKSTFKY
jgi:hypothetical protein